MMLQHSTASSSTFRAHPHHRQRLPNLNLMVGTPPRNLGNSMLPWMVRTPRCHLRRTTLDVLIWDREGPASIG